MSLVQQKARFFIDQYGQQLIKHIDQYGFCGEFIEDGVEPDINQTRLLCQCRSLFFLIDYADITNDQSLIERAFDLYIVIQQHYFNEENQTWSQYPGQSDNTVYEYAFLLFSFSKLYSVYPEESIASAINRVNEVIYEQYLSSIDANFSLLQEADGRLCQNGLMHLYEAYLEAYKTFKTEAYLSTVKNVLDKLMSLFFDDKLKLVSEYSPIDHTNGFFEPGHSFEWGSLLYESESLGIELPVGATYQALVESAENLGVTDDQLVVAELKADSSADHSRYRIWPLFERLRYYAMTDNKDKVNEVFHPFVSLFFDKNGFPIEYIDQDFQTDFDHIKSTTSYHLINCFKHII
ncbi:AGE family epimerase/isomerase [Thiotrichales bacterium 19S9-12]|nr:AGE family epimerase/isomerase [Thiotrichales bacterium 19S9-11]MCF6812452.1 AGE family epimerase/isomerase [Thiotrichales bacterium 19S9-12]